MALSLLDSKAAPLVIDASAAINLNGSGFATEIVRAIPNPVHIADIALEELQHDQRSGRNDAALAAQLIKAQALQRTTLTSIGDAHFEGLVIGADAETLDDGEAATIALALEINGVAIIDERKGRRLCAARFPTLPIAGSMDLFAHSAVVAALGREVLSKAVFQALQSARMRVSEPYQQWTIDLIGADQARHCPSLPQRLRKAA
jgi:predicted nucleic acid-binding protein